jgi:hypothetical protein
MTILQRIGVGLLFVALASPATLARVAQNDCPANASNCSVTAAGGGQANTLGNWMRGIEKSGGNTCFTGEAGAGVLQLCLGTTALATEYWEIRGGITGAGPVLSALGAATNVHGVLAAKGTGDLRFVNGSGTNFRVVDPGTVADRWITVTGATSTGMPQLSTSGGGLIINHPDGQVSYWKQNGYIQAAFGQTTAVGSATTAWVRLHSVAASNLARISSDGTDASGATPFYFAARGTGNYSLANASGMLFTVSNSSANTAVTFASIRAGSATQPPLLQAPGTNLGLGGTPGTMAALATTATTGFIGIPTMAGTPTGVPNVGASGAAYLVFDTTNEKLCRYFGGAWKCSPAFTP